MFGLFKRILCFRISQAAGSHDDSPPTHQGSTLLHELSESHEVELSTRPPESSMRGTAINKVCSGGVRAETGPTAVRHRIANDGSGGSKTFQDTYEAESSAKGDWTPTQHETAQAGTGDGMTDTSVTGGEATEADKGAQTIGEQEATYPRNSADGSGSDCTEEPGGEGDDNAAKGERRKAVRDGAARATLAAAVVLSELFTPLKVVVGCLQKIVEVADKYGENEDDIKNLERHINRIKAVVQQRIPTNTEPECREVLERRLKDILKKLGPMKRSNMLVNALTLEENASAIKNCLVEVEQALNYYLISLDQETHHIVTHIRAAQLTKDDSDRLEKLHAVKVEDALFMPERPGCLEGTRGRMLEELKNWAFDSEGPQVYWLNGHAGSGKSTIAQSFAELLYSQCKLGASFFCDRRSRDRRNVKNIIPTLSSQLTAFSDFRGTLVQQLAADTSIATTTSLKRQLEHLFVAPARDSHLSTIVLIDALDECNKVSTSDFLSILTPSLVRIPSIKFFITSRRDKHIEVHLSGHSNAVEDKRLHEVDDVGNDIKLFIETELRSLVDDCTRAGLETPPRWPAKNKIDALVKKAGKLFIFASTAVKAIKDLQYDPVLRLEELVSTKHQNPQDNPYVELDELYLRTLMDAVPAEDSGRVSHLRQSLACLSPPANLFVPQRSLNSCRLRET